MARRKKRKSLIGILITAALLGVAIAVAVSYSGGTPTPYETIEGYDDTLGKLDAPVDRATVTEILLTWRDSVAEAEIQRQRNKDDARKLAEELWERYRESRNSEAVWKALQEEYSDRRPYPEARFTYPPANPRQVMPDEFNETARTTRLGFARIAESEQGIHLIRRER